MYNATAMRGLLMFNARNVNAALTLVETVADEEQKTYCFACNETVTLSGDSLWGYTSAEEQVTITAINVHEEQYDGDTYYSVNAQLAEERIVYTDAAFADAVSRLLNMQVDYTEQGMQDEGLVSLEA
jgi:hypothetical protein